MSQRLHSWLDPTWSRRSSHTCRGTGAQWFRCQNLDVRWEGTIWSAAGSASARSGGHLSSGQSGTSALSLASAKTGTVEECSRTLQMEWPLSGPLIKLGVAALVVLAIVAVFIDGSNLMLIRRAREQRKSDGAWNEDSQAIGPEET